MPGPVPSVLGRLGAASYSIHLVQALTISAIDRIVVRIVPAINLDPLIVVPATVTFGFLVGTVVERPFLHALRTWLPGRRRSTPALDKAVDRGTPPARLAA